jgi:EmrB/QacA subfamily drug resistance transporter
VTRRSLITAAAMLGMFLAAMDQTVVGTAMPTIIKALGGLALYSWVFAAYQLAFVTTTPIFGRIADLYGRKRIYLAGILGFIGASMLCGLARSMDQLVLFRLLQGIGGGAVLPIALTIIADLYPVEQRLRIQGIFSGVWGLAAVVGPLLGGFFSDHISWRWIFFINVPVGVLAAATIMIAFQDPATAQEGRIDYAGITLLAGAAATLLLLLLWGGQAFPWRSLPAAGLAGLCGALIALFIQVEARIAHPFLPFSLFADRVVSVGAVGGFLLGTSMFSAAVYIPLFAQGVIGTSATTAGALLTPFTVCWTFSSIVAGRLALRSGYRPVTAIGMLVLVTGFFLLVRLGGQASIQQVIMAMIVLGSGMGLTASIFMISMQNAVSPPLRGLVTSLSIFTRNIGSAIGVSLQGAVLVGVLTSRMRAVGGAANLGTARIADPQAVLDPGVQMRFTAAGHEAFRQALAAALHDIFLLGLVLVALGLALVLVCMPAGSVAELAPAGAAGGGEAD